MNSISVVIPAYNEEMRILSTLNKIDNFFRKGKYNYELILIDDGSSDNTSNVARLSKIKNLIILKNSHNQGKGYSVKKGFLASKNDYVLFSDADLSTPITELTTFLKYIPRYDLIIGSRKKSTSVLIVKQPFYRILAGNIFPILVNIIVLNEFKDTQCGFKLFKRKKCLKLFKKQKLSGFGFDVELLYLSKKFKLKVKEIGVKWVNDSNSKVQFFKHSCLMFIDLLKIKFNEFLNKY